MGEREWEGEGEGVEEAVGGVELHKQDSHRKPAGKGHFLLDKPMNPLKVCGSLPDGLLVSVLRFSFAHFLNQKLFNTLYFSLPKRQGRGGRRPRDRRPSVDQDFLSREQK